MRKRNHPRQAARRRPRASHAPALNSLYRRPLRYEPLEDRRLLAAVTVNTLSDVTNLNDNLTTLREAIFATNLVGGADTIDFAPALTASGPATILLTQGELKITDSLTINGPGANLLTIDASGNDPTPDINDANGSRVFVVSSPNTTLLIDVTLSGLGVIGGDISLSGGGISNSYGNLTLDHVALLGNSSRGNGGGVHTINGNLTIRDSTIRKNIGGGAGGGVLVNMGNLTIDESDISQNAVTGQGNGGGIYFRGRAANRLEIHHTKISHNSVPHDGGGIAADLNGASGLIIDSEIIGNIAAREGAGVFASASAKSLLEFTATDVAENTSSRRSGGMRLIVAGNSSAFVTQTTIRQNSARTTGGLDVTLVTGMVTLDQVTVSGNSSTTGAGGVAVSADSTGNRAFVRRSTITDNSAQRIAVTSSIGGLLASGQDLSLTLDHTIIAGNHVTPSGGADLVLAPGLQINANHMLIGDATFSGLAETSPGVPDAHGNLIGGPVHGVIDPLLGPLADNGGFTLPDGSHILTHALLPGSPAINAGDLNLKAGVEGVPEFDQRGTPFGRVVNGRIDIGAFEYQAASDLNLLVDTLVDESDGNHTRGDLSLREAIELANLWPSIDTIHFDPALTANGPATILLTQGELKITDSVTINGPGADLLTIDASGNDPTPDLDDGNGSRVLNINDGIANKLFEVSISGLSLTGGDVGLDSPGGAILSREYVSLSSVNVFGNSAAVGGGGIYGQFNVTVNNCTFSGNEARWGGGIYGQSVTVIDSHIHGNSASLFGGGVSGFTVMISGSTIRENSSMIGGGGVSSSRLTMKNSVVRSNTSTGEGGGIHILLGGVVDAASNPFEDLMSEAAQGVAVDTGVSTITGSTIENNTSFFGGGISADRALVIEDSLITGNTAKTVGGGIMGGSYNSGLKLLRTTIGGNSAASDGGGIHFSPNVELTISSCAIDNNRAGRDGGGLFSKAANLSVQNTTVSRNQAERNGGGIAVARESTTGTNLITDSTLSGNTAGDLGGGMWTSFTTSLRNSTVAENLAGTAGGGAFVSSGTLNLDHAIVARNTSPTAGDLTGLIGASITARFSLVGNNAASELAAAGSPDAKGNLIGTRSAPINPNLGPLADNGGPTLTHALLPGSPAINAGDPAAAMGIGSIPLHDQRGAPFIRVYGGRIDMGAVESQPATLLGDYNANGVVDAADYVVWRKSIGSTSPLLADGNGDGQVNDADRLVWRANFGQTAASPTVATSSKETASAPAFVELQSRTLPVRRSVFAVARPSGFRPSVAGHVLAMVASGRAAPSQRVAFTEAAMISSARDDFAPARRNLLVAVDEAFAAFAAPGV